jgi:ATP phosphoribosyltransferase
MTEYSKKLNFAIPDGHLMNHVVPFITGAGLILEGYDKSNLNRRPILKLKTNKAKELIKNPDQIAIKVIRPQDMPTHVANANFDLAISGTDWLCEHKLRFPGSPVVEKLKLGFGKVRIVAAIHQNHENNIADYIKSFRNKNKKEYFRIATEYVYIANNFAQKNNLNPYKIIMTYGATESMIPEDCDMIIENTETGNTLKKNNLTIIKEVMKSEGCLIISKKSLENEEKRDLIQGISSLFYRTLLK